MDLHGTEWIYTRNGTAWNGTDFQFGTERNGLFGTNYGPGCQGIQGNGVQHHGLILERNGTDLYGTDYSWNGTEHNYTERKQFWNGPDRHGTVHP